MAQIKKKIFLSYHTVTAEFMQAHRESLWTKETCECLQAVDHTACYCRTALAQFDIRIKRLRFYAAIRGHKTTFCS